MVTSVVPSGFGCALLPPACLLRTLDWSYFSCACMSICYILYSVFSVDCSVFYLIFVFLFGGQHCLLQPYDGPICMLFYLDHLKDIQEPLKYSFPIISTSSTLFIWFAFGSFNTLWVRWLAHHVCHTKPFWWHYGFTLCKGPFRLSKLHVHISILVTFWLEFSSTRSTLSVWGCLFLGFLEVISGSFIFIVYI